MSTSSTRVATALGALAGVVLAVAVEPNPSAASDLFGQAMIVAAGALAGRQIPLRYSGPMLAGVVIGHAAGAVVAVILSAFLFHAALVQALMYGLGGLIGAVAAAAVCGREQLRQRRFTPSIEAVFFQEECGEDELDEDRLWPIVHARAD